MILDYMTRVDAYASVLPHFAQAMAFAKTLVDAPVGRYEEDDYFVLVQEFETKMPADKDYELHRKYADVHVVLEGQESLGYDDIAVMTPKEDFNETKDMQMLDGVGQYVTINPGMFCVVLPHDGHKPGCCVEAPGKLRKFVVKIPV
ncbi:YhcH/YjgK/YiaL family protein [Bengtsoniella intestinalis]|uniref:YhcH/YjgK/YiaL family protein n=1 Tax=Bengtsoniella intestinalis TaxID=3073143 RepID=UPI00391F7A90